MKRRFKVDPPLASGQATLEGEEARHLRVVLRARAGDHLSLFDGAGREADAEVMEIGRDAITCRVLGAVRTTPHPACQIELACALPRAGAADDVVRVAVEIGATAIRPLVTERGVWRPEDPDESQRSERFVRAAVAALKQSGLSWMPEILPPAAPSDLSFAPDQVAVMGSVAPDAAPVHEALAKRRPIRHAIVIVGPEGGLTEREEKIIISKGAIPVRLGRGILRVETAVVALVSHVVSACH